MVSCHVSEINLKLTICTETSRGGATEPIKDGFLFLLIFSFTFLKMKITLPTDL